jgi:hypothetical protein
MYKNLVILKTLFEFFFLNLVQKIICNKKIQKIGKSAKFHTTRKAWYMGKN